MKIVIGCDDPNELTESVVADLKRRGHQVAQLAPESWPDIALAAAEAVVSGAADQGVLFCWTGTGTAMAANKVTGIRAALVWDPWIADGARRWNDANVLVMSSQRTSLDEARAILDAWFAVEAPDPEEADNIARLGAIERKEP